MSSRRDRRNARLAAKYLSRVRDQDEEALLLYGSRNWSKTASPADLRGVLRDMVIDQAREDVTVIITVLNFVAEEKE